MAAPVESNTRDANTSKQLLYSEKFGGTLLERTLKITGKEAKLEKPCLPPPSSVLSRVKEFLPKLKAANEELKNRPPEEVNMEAINDDGPVIEMNLSLVPLLDTSSDESSSDEDEESEDEDCEDEKDDDKDDDDVPSVSDFLAGVNNAGKGRKRPLLEILDGEKEKSDQQEGGE